MNGNGAMDDLLTLREIAQQYHVSEETVRRLIRSGTLPFEMVGPFRVRRSAIERQATQSVTPTKCDHKFVDSLHCLKCGRSKASIEQEGKINGASARPRSDHQSAVGRTDTATRRDTKRA